MDNAKDFISLTEKEIEKYKSRPNEIAQVLVDKALLYEAKQAEREEAELKEMDFLQENAAAVLKWDVKRFPVPAAQPFRR